MGELLYEIHGYGIPRLSGNRKLLEKSIRFMTHRFGMGTSGTGFAVVFDIGRKSRPIVMHADLVECLCLTKMSCKGWSCEYWRTWSWRFPESGI